MSKSQKNELDLGNQKKSKKIKRKNKNPDIKQKKYIRLLANSVL